MTNDVLLQVITLLYAACNSVRVLSYVPQIVAVAREQSGAHAVSVFSWAFWLVSHATTALYCGVIVKDTLLALLMWGNAFGCLGVVALTVAKRRRYGWSRAAA